MTWKECEEQVKGVRGASYKSFETEQEAKAAFEFAQLTLEREKQRKAKLVPARELIADSVCVDASCIGNPGDVEYRGLYTATHEVLFHKRPMAYGTNNLGEFLAIVHALAYLKKQGRDIPIYSDSETAILWVTDKKARTKLKQTSENGEIFNLTERALKWLESNEYTNPILKWNTQLWGEIPADFGRK